MVERGRWSVGHGGWWLGMLAHGWRRRRLDGSTQGCIGTGVGGSRVTTNTSICEEPTPGDNGDNGGLVGVGRVDAVEIDNDYLGINPGGTLGTAQAKPLLLVDPNSFLIDQLPSSTQHPLGCCISTHG